MVKIYTKNGDSGFTSLYDGTKVSKDDIILDLIGNIDELNSFIGNINEINIEFLNNIQYWLFDLGTIIANPKKKYNFDVNLEYTKQLEENIDKYTNELPMLKNFILPSNSINICRAVCRKVERKLVSFKKINNDFIDNNCIIFINRLSDYFFTLARYVNFINNKNEIIYKKTNILTEI